MRVSASLERAQRYLTSLRRAARVRPLDLAKVVGRVAAVLFLLEVLYLAVGNAVVRSHVIQRAVSTSDGFHLDFSGAYTLWPGHVHVRDISLRIEDYNVQFEVAIASAELDIAIGQLPFKKFRVTRLDAEGTRFRMRHKLLVVGDDAERVAAYPPIRDFADPPYYKGVRSPPIPDADYDLWQVKIENVTARVSELWVMEYRFVGTGEARGSFVVKPARWVQVEPARLRLDDGKLTLGEHLVAEHLSGHLGCDIPDMDVQATEGLQVLREISGNGRLQLRGGKLAFLRAYLARLGSARYAGNADFDVDFNLVRGVLQPGTRASMQARPFELLDDATVAAGDVWLSLQRPAPTATDKAEDELRLVLDAPRVSLQRGKVAAPAPSLEGVRGFLRLRAADLRGDVGVEQGRLVVGRASAPSLAWFGPIEKGGLDGSAQATLELKRDADGRVSGRTELHAQRAQLRKGDWQLLSDARVELGFGEQSSGAFALSPLRIRLADLSVRQGSKRCQPVSVAIDGSRCQIDPNHGFATSGLLDVHVAPLQALLPLFLSDPLRSVTGSVLDLKTLQAQVALQLSNKALELNVLDARSGNLRLRGYLNQREREPRGAFLLSSGPINVGVTLANGSTEVSPFVSDDWLATAAHAPASRSPSSG